MKALSAGSNVDLLMDQIKEFKPELVSIKETKVAELREALSAAKSDLGGYAPEIAAGVDGMCEVAAFPSVEATVTGIVGCAGLTPTVAAIKAGKDICLANKETLIAGGPFVLPLAKEHGINILPADSEHSALFQCIQGLPEGGLRRIILTASGGAFRDWDVERLKTAKVSDALKHPNWDMGKKITIDSATLMNKGLEVIEAHYLYGTSYDDIEIVIHPQSIIHSMVETADSSVLAQLGWPDMRLPILYSMSWPHRLKVDYGRGIDEKFDLVKLGSMTFKAPDEVKYPCIPLAYAAGRRGGTMTGCLNAANEMANELFRQGKFDFFGIPKVIEQTMDAHQADYVEDPTLDDILTIDAWAREQVRREAGKLANKPILL